MMTIFCIRLSAIALLTSFYITSFGMDQIIIPSLYSCPKEIHKATFGLLNLASQDRLRGTCHYWKKIGDERTSQVYLLNLLHSPSNTTKETKARILFHAVYHNDYDLAETILKSVVPKNYRLYYSCDGFFDPYHIVQRSENHNMRLLLEQYEYNTPTYSCGDYNQAPEFNELPEPDILTRLIISSIVGDNNSIATIINIELNNSDIHANLMRKKGYKEIWSRPEDYYIKKAFKIIIQNDDVDSISSLQHFLADNPSLDFWLDEFFEVVHCFKSKKVFKSLLQQHKNLNMIERGSDNGCEKNVTLKNMTLGINWSDGISRSEDPIYYDEVEAIMNECGAKTYEELESEKTK